MLTGWPGCYKNAHRITRKHEVELATRETFVSHIRHPRQNNIIAPSEFQAQSLDLSLLAGTGRVIEAIDPQ